MNEGFIIIVFVAVVAVIYFVCSLFRHGNCDIGKCFTLLAGATGAILGVFLFLHALASVKAKAPYEDALWTAIAGIILTISSCMQMVNMFREIFAKQVEPVRTSAAAK